MKVRESTNNLPAMYHAVMNGWLLANQELRPKATFKTTPVDFCVEEVLTTTPEGDGEHRYLLIKKTDLSTRDVAQALAKHFDVPLLDIGYAGLKDKRSVSTQWFSVWTFKDQRLPQLASIDLLEDTRHKRKLRLGDCDSNRFRIALRQFTTNNSVPEVPSKVPNYFGEQRFGRDGTNVEHAKEWLDRGKPKISRFMKSIYISSLRSFLFNCVLSGRVEARTWDCIVQGDVIQDGKATGPLWGRGRSSASDEALAIEEETLASHQDICAQLEWVGLSHARRDLWVEPLNSSSRLDGECLNVQFDLPSGSYASTVIREMIDYEQVVRHSS